jgi:hypothetical protein
VEIPGLKIPALRTGPDRKASCKPPRLLFGAIPPHDVQQQRKSCRMESFEQGSSSKTRLIAARDETKEAVSRFPTLIFVFEAKGFMACLNRNPDGMGQARELGRFRQP